MKLYSITRKRAPVCLPRAACLTALVNGILAHGYAQSLTPPSDPIQSGRDPLRYGPFDVFPRVTGGITFDDNIYIQERDKTADVIWNFSPGLLLAAGDYEKKETSYAYLDYAPTFLLFTEETRNNAIDHEAKLDLDWHPGKFSLGLQQTFSDYSGSVVDVGNRVDRQIYLTALQLQYEISPKTSVEINGTQSVNCYENVQSFNEWTAGTWLDYWLTPKVRVGAGLTGGWVDNESSVDQTYQQGLARVAYSMTAKLDLHASAGVEVRQFEDGRDNRVNGVFTLGTTYKPQEQTDIILEAHRRTLSSVVLVDQNYVTTGLNGTVRQRFLAKYVASLSLGYDHLEYFATREGVTSDRSDDYFYARIGMEMEVTDKLGVGVFYQFRENNSSDSVFGFDNHQLGIQAAYRF